MNEIFGTDYSRSYDSLYREKDYEAECDLLERLFDGEEVKSVLDLGCGTGGHSVVLAQRGYEVTGIDRSASMLELARSKASAADVQVNLTQGDIRSVDPGGQYEAVISMFAVMGYQLTNEDVLKALKTARSALRPGGLLVFDVWYGPSVLTERPSEKVRVLEDGPSTTIRASSGVLRIPEHVCDVTMRVWKCGESTLEAAVEEHSMRFFFPMELRLFLECAGFKLDRLGAFPDFDQDPDSSTWNVMALARAF